MNPMIEAGARALFEHDYQCSDRPEKWIKLPIGNKAIWHEMFRAAVRAMMDAPVSDAMTKAGEQFGWIEAESTELWRAMCAAVLEGE